MTNMTKLGNGLYVVRTQAGFKKAIKQQFSGDYDDWKLIAARNLYGYPIVYPALISLYASYQGDTVFVCKSVHVNTVKAAIADA